MLLTFELSPDPTELFWISDFKNIYIWKIYTCIMRCPGDGSQVYTRDSLVCPSQLTHRPKGILCTISSAPVFWHQPVTRDYIWDFPAIAFMSWFREVLDSAVNFIWYYRLNNSSTGNLKSKHFCSNTGVPNPGPTVLHLFYLSLFQ